MRWAFLCEGGRCGGVATEASAPRVFLSYAHQSDAHAEAVRDLWIFLRAHGVDARLDRVAAQQRQDWSLWMGEQVREADHVLAIASAAYRLRAEGRARADEGRGVQWEAGLIRNLLYENQSVRDRVVPVVLLQAALSQAPFTDADLISTQDDPEVPASGDALRRDVERLVDLTLLSPAAAVTGWRC